MNRIDFYNAFIIVFLAGTIVSFLINQFLEWIDFRERCRSGGEIPSVLKNIPESSCFDSEKLRKICAYENGRRNPRKIFCVDSVVRSWNCAFTCACMHGILSVAVQRCLPHYRNAGIVRKFLYVCLSVYGFLFHPGKHTFNSF